MGSLDQHTAEFAVPETGKDWSAEVSSSVNAEAGSWALLRVLSYPGEDVPTEFYFARGWPELILLILSRLCEHTGPLVVVPDTGEAPVVIWQGRDLEEALTSWEHTAHNVGDADE